MSSGVYENSVVLKNIPLGFDMNQIVDRFQTLGKIVDMKIGKRCAIITFDEKATKEGAEFLSGTDIVDSNGISYEIDMDTDCHSLDLKDFGEDGVNTDELNKLIPPVIEEPIENKKDVLYPINQPMVPVSSEAQNQPPVKRDEEIKFNEEPPVGKYPNLDIKEEEIRNQHVKEVEIGSKQVKEEEIENQQVEEVEIENKQVKEEEIRNQHVKVEEIENQQLKDEEIRNRHVKEEEIRNRHVKEEEADNNSRIKKMDVDYAEGKKAKEDQILQNSCKDEDSFTLKHLKDAMNKLNVPQYNQKGMNPYKYLYCKRFLGVILVVFILLLMAGIYDQKMVIAAMSNHIKMQFYGQINQVVVNKFKKVNQI